MVPIDTIQEGSATVYVVEYTLWGLDITCEMSLRQAAIEYAISGRNQGATNARVTKVTSEVIWEDEQ